MQYFTLTEIGRQSTPPDYKTTYKALLMLLGDSDLPRSETQIVKAGGSREGIEELIKQGFVEIASLPKPEPKARIRIPSIEKIVESEEKRQLSYDRYINSPKGRAALDRYWKEGKGKEAARDYWKSQKGRATQKRYRLRKSIEEMENYLEVKKGIANEAEIRAMIKDKQRELELMIQEG